MIGNNNIKTIHNFKVFHEAHYCILNTLFLSINCSTDKYLFRLCPRNRFKLLCNKIFNIRWLLWLFGTFIICSNFN